MQPTTSDTPGPPSDRRTERLVLCESSLWSAGHGLTTGWFLRYLSVDLGASAAWVGAIDALPELVGVVQLGAPRLIDALGNRKRTYLLLSLVGRIAILGVPLLALSGARLRGFSPLWVLAAFLFVNVACGVIAYVAYLSWLSDLIPSERWGRFFGVRSAWVIGTRMVFMLAGGWARDRWVGAHSDQPLAIYAALFFVGAALLLASLVPISLVADVPLRNRQRGLLPFSEIAGVLGDRAFRKMIGFGCWLALWAGLTQAAFTLYAKSVLGIPLQVMIAAMTIMQLCQMMIGPVAGWLSDRIGNKPVLFVGVVNAAFGSFFWLLATPATWWMIFAAYVAFGGWAAVNICGQNLMLKLAPRSNNTPHIAMYQTLTALCAGTTGILGGWWLDQLLKSPFEVALAGMVFGPYQLFFLASWLGRTSAALWIVPIREPGSRPVLQVFRALWQKRSLPPRIAEEPDARQTETT